MRRIELISLSTSFFQHKITIAKSYYSLNFLFFLRISSHLFFGKSQNVINHSKPSHTKGGKNEEEEEEALLITRCRKTWLALFPLSFSLLPSSSPSNNTMLSVIIISPNLWSISHQSILIDRKLSAGAKAEPAKKSCMSRCIYISK